MSPENVERYGRMVEAWQRGDLEAWLDDAQEGEMHTSGAFPGFEPVYAAATECVRSGTS